MHLNIILSSTPLSFRQVSSPKPCMHLSSPHTCYMPLPSHSSRFDHPNILVEEYRSLSSSFCSFLHSVTSSLLRQELIAKENKVPLSLGRPRPKWECKVQGKVFPLSYMGNGDITPFVLNLCTITM